MPQADQYLVLSSDPNTTKQATYALSGSEVLGRVLLYGTQSGGTITEVAVGADGSVLTAPAAARQHWYSTTTLTAGSTGTASTADGADDWSRITGYVVVTYADGTALGNGDFTLEVQQCRNDSFTSGTVYLSPFTAQTVPAAAFSYPSYVKYLAFDVQRVGLYVRVQLKNTGSSDFTAVNAEATLVTVVR